MDLVSELRRWPWPMTMDEPVIVGVSGGVDSMVLAEGLARAGFGKLVVAHLHHGLRGVEADEDAGWVRAWAGAHGFDFEFRRVDVACRARELGESVESAGRAARREFFLDISRERGLRHVVLAHHADDQVETLLMHLLRGAGTHGLGGMRAVSAWNGLVVIRPLLAVWRRDLESWAEAERIHWREDATNQSSGPFRNRIRHQVVPALEAAAGRDVKEALRRAAVLAAEDDAELTATASARRANLLSRDGRSLQVRGLRDLPTALARRVVREWLVSQDVTGVGFAVVEAGLQIARSSGRPAACNLEGGRRLRRRGGELFLDVQR